MSSLPSPPRLERPLSPEKCAKYEQLVMSIVERTADQYTNYIRPKVSDRKVDLGRWELVKTRENLKIYKSRDGLQPNVFAEHTSQSRSSYSTDKWLPLTSALCIGSFVGSLEDAMYGATTPTELSMATRSLLIQDEFIDHRVLQDLKQPTVADPFHYVGLKWALRSSRVAKIVRKRDLVYVEASGFHDIQHRGASERVGYVVCHSVDPLELELGSTTHGVVRARYSMCTIFRQKARGIIDMYVTMVSDPGGSLKPSLAVKSATGALAAAAAVMECALYKKLAWMVDTDHGNPSKSDDVGSGSCCSNCARPSSSFRSLGACGVCRAPVCSRCTSAKKLALGSTVQELAFQSVQVCMSCVSTASRKLDGSRIAMEQYVLSRRRRKSPALGLPRNTITRGLQSLGDGDVRLTSLHSEASSDTSNEAAVEPSTKLSSERAKIDVHSKRTESSPSVVVQRPRRKSRAKMIIDDDDGPVPSFRNRGQSFVRSEQRPKEVVPVPNPQQQAELNERVKMLQQMTALRIQAEQTYNALREQTTEVEKKIKHKWHDRTHLDAAARAMAMST